MAANIIFLLVPWEPTPGQIALLQKAAGPEYEVVARTITLRERSLPEDISAETWRRVKVLMTFVLLPTRDMVPNLEYVQLLSAGCNHVVDSSLYKDPSVTFCTASGIHAAPITEWVFACFLAFQHQIPTHLEDQKQHNWVVPVKDETVEDAVGLRVGILGYGSIGRQTARVAKAFGMDVHAYTLRERSTPESRRDDIDSFTEPGLGDPEGIFPSKWFHGADQLDAFLSSGLDLLVVLLPLTDKTKGMISTKQFECLARKKTYFVNAGRGALVDTDALCEALDKGLIRGAALDVTDPEPLPKEHRLWDCPNVIITPHVSGNTNSYYERACKILAQNLERRTKGETRLVNAVDRKLGY